MKPSTLSRTLAAVALVGASAYLTASVGCGGTNATNPMPTVRDSGGGMDSTMKKDGGMPPSDSSGSSSSGDTGPLPDVGNCKSDASTCNSCYTAAQAAADPLNACSAYTKNCVPFDPSRVPSHTSL